MNVKDIKVNVTIGIGEYYINSGGCGDNPSDMDERIQKTIDDAKKDYDVIGFVSPSQLDVDDQNTFFIMNNGSSIAQAGTLNLNGSQYPLRVCLRKKEKKYRYVTDGVVKEGSPGQYLFDATKLIKYEDVYPCYRYPRIWFDREEVTE